MASRTVLRPPRFDPMPHYTGKGDDGTTGLLFGGRVPKDSAGAARPMAPSTRPRRSSGWPGPRSTAGGELDELLVDVDARPLGADGRAGHRSEEPCTSSRQRVTTRDGRRALGDAGGRDRRPVRDADGVRHPRAEPARRAARCRPHRGAAGRAGRACRRQPPRCVAVSEPAVEPAVGHGPVAGRRPFATVAGRETSSASRKRARRRRGTRRAGVRRTQRPRGRRRRARRRATSPAASSRARPARCRRCWPTTARRSSRSAWASRPRSRSTALRRAAAALVGAAGTATRSPRRCSPPRPPAVDKKAAAQAVPKAWPSPPTGSPRTRPTRTGPPVERGHRRRRRARPRSTAARASPRRSRFARDLVNEPAGALTPTRLAAAGDRDRRARRPHRHGARREGHREGRPRRAARRVARLGRAARLIELVYEPAAGRRHRRARRQGHHVRLGRAVAQDGRRDDDDEDRHGRRRRGAGDDVGTCRRSA